MSRIELDDRIAEQLKAQAGARNLTFNQYLEVLSRAVERQPSNGNITLEEFEKILDEFSAGSDQLPLLPPDFSRADIYQDHD